MAIRLITKTTVYMMNPYRQTGTPNRLEHPPTGQAFAMSSPYERYPEKSMPAMAMMRMVLSATIFFIAKKKKNKGHFQMYGMREKLQTQANQVK